VDHLDLDLPEIRSRFAVVYQVQSLSHGHRFELKARVPENDPIVPSVSDMWKAALWGEREAHDMFGVEFDGNPDLRRLLMPEDYPGFPLRKDYPLRGRGERDSFPKYRPGVGVGGLFDPRGTGESGAGEETNQAGGAPEASGTGASSEIRTQKAQDPQYQGTHPEPRFSVEEEDSDLGGKSMVLNIGPQHPATHGTLRVMVRLSGESISSSDTEIGFLHTGFEKLAESMTYQQWVTVTDRMNYMSAMNNNVGYAVACEELLGITPPRRAQVLRVILCELSRIGDHVLCVGLQGMDMGAFSIMLWAFEKREKIYDIMEAVTGARLTTSYTRIGGLFRDVPPDFPDMVRKFLAEFPAFLDEFEGMTVGNRIFEDRLRKTGFISAEKAVEWGLSGPVLRASGVAHDVRKARPYCGYERYDFAVPTRTEGDSWGRFLQRIAEMRESMKIIRQALEDLPNGPVSIETKKIALPDKSQVFDNIESLIHHFKLIMFGHGIRPERGAEVYSATEAPNGELGFYIVSSAEMNPYRIRVRPPSLYNYAIFPRLIEGCMVSDAVAILSSLNIIAGELDR
jgi:NADH dehydrogenase I D subunit